VAATHGNAFRSITLGLNWNHFNVSGSHKYASVDFGQLQQFTAKGLQNIGMVIDKIEIPVS